MIHTYILNEKDEPEPCSDLRRWGDFLEKHKRVAKTRLSDGVTMVSTVFLGIDHRFGGGGPPILFETMAFHDWDLGHEQTDMGAAPEQWRYATRAEALEGHAHAVAYYEERLLSVAERVGEIAAEKKKTPVK